jgi:hypothetical protein
MKRQLRLLSAALLTALAPAAWAQTAGEVDQQVGSIDAATANAGQTRVATRIASSFTSLAGSQDNALALVNGLRNGTSVTLTTPTDATGTGTTGTTSGGTGSTGTTTGTTTDSTSTTITPPTGRMGWGEVFISLALAKAELANLGITDPTAEQLQAALTGGSITQADGTVVDVKGVLEMRADGMGWGRIAQAEGTKLGPVVSSLKSAHARMASLSTGDSASTSTLASKSLRTASGGTTHGATSGGIVTANGGGASASVHGHGHGRAGIVTANGSGSALAGNGHSSRGITTASGAAGGSARGLVTAGGSMGGGHGNAYGRGLVTANGGSAGVLTGAALGSGHGNAGLVTGAGAGASGSGITTAQGGGNGHGATHGRGHKGGG